MLENLTPINPNFSETPENILPHIDEVPLLDDNTWMDSVKDGMPLRMVPTDYITEDMCLIAVTANFNNLEYIPNRFKTPHSYAIAFNRSPASIKFFPRELITEAMAANAIQYSPTLIEHVPARLITTEMAERVVCIDGKLLRYIPHSLRTEEVCLKALKQCVPTMWDAPAMKFVPINVISQDLCNTAIMYNIFSFKHIPDNFKTDGMCLELIAKDFVFIRYLPEPLSPIVKNTLLEYIKNHENAYSNILRPTEEMTLLHKVLWEV